jgi:lipid II:glycine glycyltransferase (peptidoglycan interpeptide bridge formation enzyme)
MSPDIRQTKDYALFMKSLSWKVERVKGVNYFIKSFPFVGSFIKLQRPENIDLKFIQKLCRKYRCFMLVVEPNSAADAKTLLKSDFKLNRHPYLVSKTLKIDLTKSRKELLKTMHPKTRYNIRLAQKNGLKIKLSKNIDEFAQFWNYQRFGKNPLFSQTKEIVNLYKAFNENAYHICIYKNHTLVSAILMLLAQSEAYYMYAASSSEGKKLHAPTLNVWQAFLHAKKAKATVFDFEGLYDPRFPQKTWLGFTKFKKSFGGYEVTYPGSFLKYRLPI